MFPAFQLPLLFCILSLKLQMNSLRKKDKWEEMGVGVISVCSPLTLCIYPLYSARKQSTIFPRSSCSWPHSTPHSVTLRALYHHWQPSASKRNKNWHLNGLWCFTIQLACLNQCVPDCVVCWVHSSKKAQDSLIQMNLKSWRQLIFQFGTLVLAGRS